jgi:hypothetical protein
VGHLKEEQEQGAESGGCMRPRQVEGRYLSHHRIDRPARIGLGGRGQRGRGGGDSEAEGVADDEDEDEEGQEGARAAAPPQVQCFARTAAVLGMGMCGGPVLRADGRCAGVVEGIVDAEALRRRAQDSEAGAKLVQSLGGAAVYIDSGVLAEFLDAVEEQLEAQ